MPDISPKAYLREGSTMAEIQKKYARQERFEIHLRLLGELARSSTPAVALLKIREHIVSQGTWASGEEVENALKLLNLLGLVAPDGRLTQLAWDIEPFVQLIGPRLAVALHAANKFRLPQTAFGQGGCPEPMQSGCPATVAKLAALLAAEAPFFIYRKRGLYYGNDGYEARQKKFQGNGSKSDLSTLLRAYNALKDKAPAEREVFADEHLLSLRAFGQALRIENELTQIMRRLGWKLELGDPSEDALTEAFFHGYPDRLLWRDMDDWQADGDCHTRMLPYDSLFYGICRPSFGVDLVLAVGLVHIPDRFGDRNSYVALSGITPERVRELMPRGTVTVTEDCHYYAPDRRRVECHRIWRMNTQGDDGTGTVFCKQFWQQAFPSSATAAVLAKAICKGELGTPSSPEYKKYQEIVRRAPHGFLSEVSESQIINWWTERLQDVCATRATDVVDNNGSLRLGWDELASICGVADLQSRIEQIERDYPDVFTVGGAELPVHYHADGNGVTLTITNLAVAQQVLQLLPLANFPPTWAEKKILVNVDPGTPALLQGYVTNLDQLRRDIACRLAAGKLPHSGWVLEEIGDSIVQTVQVTHPDPHPGRTETTYLVAGAHVRAHSWEDACALRNDFLEHKLFEIANSTGMSCCPKRTRPDLTDITPLVRQSMGELVYLEGNPNPTKDSVRLAAAHLRELVTELYADCKQQRLDLVQAAQELRLWAQQNQMGDAASRLNEVIQELGTTPDAAIPRRTWLNVSRAEIEDVRLLLPDLDEPTRAKMSLLVACENLTRRADRGYGDPKHDAKQAIAKLRAQMGRGEIDQALASLPDVEELVKIAETSTATSGLKGGCEGKPPGNRHRTQS